MKTRRYSELRRFQTFEERFDYLMLEGEVGASTFGYNRYLNQDFYRSSAWRHARRQAIIRDEGRDLGIFGYEIHHDLLVHHMNPMTSDDILHGEDWVYDLEYLITTSKDTHNAIHFGDRSKLRVPYVERSRGDTRLW